MMNKQIVSVESAILLLFLLMVGMSGCIQQEKVTSEEAGESTHKSVEIQETLPSTVNNGLGNLCSGEAGCLSFCQNNRGQCETYCNGKDLELCTIIFSTERTSVGSDENKETCISNSKPLFTTPFTDLSKINHITPIGNIKAGSQSRSYIFVKTHANGTRMLVPLYAPTSVTLFGIVYAYRGKKSEGARAEYRLDFKVSCEVTFSFDHIAQLSDRLKQFAPTIPAENTRRDTEISVSVAEGELLGYTDGGQFGGAWDFLLFNYAKEVFHVNPSRWTSEHNQYADCPYDYFTEDLKKQYYSMFASAGGEKTHNPTCRSTSRDVAETLSGGWFKSDSTDAQGSRLYLGSDFSTVDLVVDEGDPLATRSILSIRHQNAPIKPEDVKVGGSVCYSDGTNYAFLKLLTATQMAADIGTGGCPSSLPTSVDIWDR